MKHILILIFLSLLANFSQAKSESEILLTEEESESVEIIDSKNLEAPKMSIREIKDYLKTIDQSSTCLDEYLKRRNQLMAKLAFTPLLATIETLGAVYVGGTAGVLIAQARSGGVEAGWDALGYAIGGAMIGGTMSIAAAATSTAFTGMDAYDIDQLAKSLGELHLNKERVKSAKLYQKYLKTTNDPISQEAFFEEVLEADRVGSLCDGSMLKRPRFRLGAKLKYKVSRSRDLFRAINQ